MLGNRANQHNFAKTPQVNMARSSFDRSSTVKDTIQFDDLNPIFVDEVIPGDSMNLNLRMFARLATQIVPIMDNMYIDYFFFFIPNRLVFDNWEKLNGAQDNPGDSTDYILPQLTSPASGGFPVGSIYDKMGLPTGVPNLVVKNTLPLRAYNLVYNQWFRDENMQPSIDVPRDNGPDAPTDFQIRKRGKRHDYFTSALPWPQKGPSVQIPLGASAPVYGQLQTAAFGNAGGQANIWQGWRNVSPIHLNGEFRTAGTQAITGPEANVGAYSLGAKEDYVGKQAYFVPPYADLTGATAATINQLREAFMMQSLFELDARGGTRYVEILAAHFNVVSPDFRLQRAEYLGGGRTKINSHPVAQTAPTESGDTPQANLSAFATSSDQGERIGFSHSFVEHGYVIGMCAARADLTYQQGMNRMWNRSTRFDFFWPKLQELGEQAILNKEIYAQGTAADNLVFGYQERFAEYRYKPSEIHGQFRSTYATSLDVWHLAEEFGSLPNLSSTFITSTTPIERAIAVPSEPHLLFDGWFQLKHARPMMTYSVPATFGRF